MPSTILVTGASGKLGSLVVSQLLAQGAKPESIAVMVKSEDKGRLFKDMGLQVKIADYNDEKTLKQAVQGVSRALLISSNSVGKRFNEHNNFIKAIKESGAAFELLAYTSILHAGTSPMLLASEHKATEEAIAESNIPYSILRNGWYIENVTGQIGVWEKSGSILGASGQGRISAASRNDFAEAAAKVLLSKDAPKNIYELGGQPGYTLNELASLASEVTGTAIKAVHMSKTDYVNTLLSFGLPGPLAEIIADAEDNAARGYLEDTSGDLHTLLGRPSQSIKEVMKASL